MSPLIENPPVKAKPYVDTDVLFSIRPELLNDAYMYLHCHIRHTTQDMLIRIWPSTFLISKTGGEKSKLVHAENISFAPVWTIIPENFHYTFLLIFGGLPKSCRVFDLAEDIPQPGGFFVPNIVRTETDVYHIDLPL
ncbi:MAG: hypothetical protein OEU76_04280 [Cyclobacteriaceae bacterium]|nr:hypothetical protein [Cyclobacteriaceae bacterium]